MDNCISTLGAIQERREIKLVEDRKGMIDFTARDLGPKGPSRGKKSPNKSNEFRLKQPVFKLRLKK